VLDIRPVVFQPTATGDGFVAPPEAFTGRYILLGTLCYFSYQIDFDLITDFGTGQLSMNLPFPTLENMITREGNLNDASEGTQYHITGLASSGSSQLNLFFSDKVSSGVQDNAFRQGFPITLTTADSFHIEGFYEADLS